MTSIKIPLSNRNHPGLLALIDADDLPLIEPYRWYASKIGYNYYATTWIDAKTTYMHRILLDAPAHLKVDHANGDGLDNRRANIRLATNSQNSANQVHGRVSSSGFRGVYPMKGKPGFWWVGIKKDRKSHYLGLVRDPVEGALLYDAAAREVFGPFAHTNF